MKLTRCDQCETELGEGVMEKFTVTRETHFGIQSFGVSPGPWDFCSWKCLEAFSDSRAARVRAGGLIS